MSPLEVLLPEHEDQREYKNLKPENVVNLNDIVRQVLQPYQQSAGRNMDLIVRCANLPEVYVAPGVISTVFNELVRMIINHPFKGKKFIHFFCDEEGKLEKKLYKIQIHANLVRDEKWKQLHQETFINLQSALLPFGAQLVEHEISAAGCLFTVTLQGKIG